MSVAQRIFLAFVGGMIPYFVYFVIKLLSIHTDPTAPTDLGIIQLMQIAKFTLSTVLSFFFLFGVLGIMGLALTPVSSDDWRHFILAGMAAPAIFGATLKGVNDRPMIPSFDPNVKRSFLEMPDDPTHFGRSLGSQGIQFARWEPSSRSNLVQRISSQSSDREIEIETIVAPQYYALWDQQLTISDTNSRKYTVRLGGVSRIVMENPGNTIRITSDHSATISIAAPNAGQKICVRILRVESIQQGLRLLDFSAELISNKDVCIDRLAFSNFSAFLHWNSPTSPSALPVDVVQELNRVLAAAGFRTFNPSRQSWVGPNSAGFPTRMVTYYWPQDAQAASKMVEIANRWLMEKGLGGRLFSVNNQTSLSRNRADPSFIALNYWLGLD